MTDTKANLDLGLGIFAVMTFILGWFVYGGINGALAMVLIEILIGFTCLFGLIPIIGVLFYWLVAHFWVIPWVLSLTQLSNSFVVGFLFSLGLLGSIILTIISTIAIIGWAIK
jgi:hypothetical protein